jgi:ABC-type phosphate transport system substrate-binding protein
MKTLRRASLMSAARLMIALAFLAVLATRGSAQAPVAVVVNRGNPQGNIALADLRDIYLGSLTRFKAGGERVILLEFAETRARFYDSVLRMSPERVKRHWIGLVFSGDGTVPPREIRTGEDLLRYVASHPGAIGFVPVRIADSTVKVITVDGLLPTDPRYPIR